MDISSGLLVVDDHALVREGLKRILSMLGPTWFVSEAATAGEALELLRQRCYRLAIVDLMLPDMPGLDLIGRIRHEFPSTAVLVLSMHDEAAYAVRAFEAGASGYLTKGSAATELIAAVTQIGARDAPCPAGPTNERAGATLSPLDPLPPTTAVSSALVEPDPLQ